MPFASQNSPATHEASQNSPATHEEGAVLEATSTSSNPQTHDRAECAVDRIVIGEIAEIPGKQRGNRSYTGTKLVFGA
jgi:hypothetical protein